MSIDVAVIGCGYWGPKLIRNFDADERLNLAAVCDTMEERLSGTRRIYPQVRTSTDLKSIIEDSTIDALVIATPISTHYTLAREALLAGKHVFVEKPLAMRISEVRELMLLSREVGRVLMVDDTFLYNGKAAAVKALIDRGELGEIYYMDAVRVNLGELKPMGRSTGFYPDAGVLWDLAPHDVAMMTWFVDAEPARVVATGAGPIAYCPGQRPIMAWGSIVFDNGVIGHFHVNWLAPEQQKRMSIVGSDRMIVYDDVNEECPVSLYDKGVELLPGISEEEPNIVRYREGKKSSVPWDEREPLRVAVEHFRDSILEGHEPLSGAAFSMKVVGCLEAAEQSIAVGGEPVEIHSLTAVGD